MEVPLGTVARSHCRTGRLWLRVWVDMEVEMSHVFFRVLLSRSAALTAVEDIRRKTTGWHCRGLVRGGVQN